MSWALRRKLVIFIVLGAIALGALLWLGASLFIKPASCFDRAQNQGEAGIDCGGPCAAVCSNQARAPIVTWARQLKTATSTYTAVAYVENPNGGGGIGARNVRYAFRVLDADNALIVERDGIVNIPPQTKVPIIEPNIDTGTRIPAHTFLDFSAAPAWVRVPEASVPKFQIKNLTLAPDGSRVTATLQNVSDLGARHVTVAAILFDAEGNAQAASKTTLPDVPAQGSQDVVFTWPSGASDAVSAEITPLLPF